MDVTAWKGGAYGIRVGEKNVSQYFKPNIGHINVDIEGSSHVFPLSPTFWTTCPEFRNKIIGGWLKSRGLAPWPKGHPPKLKLLPLGTNRFKLTT